VNATVAFTREHLRAPLTLVLLISLPAAFVGFSSQVLGEFADALGGRLAGDAAAALGAGWAAAFIAGSLGFFQIVSSRGADHRLALAGRGPARVALARLVSSIVLAFIAVAAAFLTLGFARGFAHPVHEAAALLAFALIYLGVGSIIGSIISAPLEGSLAVAFVFMLDVFSGPGMTEGGGSAYSISREAGALLISGASGQGSNAGEWLAASAWAFGALGLAFLSYVVRARSRV
jgi:hypothetical protein